jgi:uncharacterized protein YukE
MSLIKADTKNFEELLSDFNKYSIDFKTHADQFNDLILKTQSCWVGDKANEYRDRANSFNKAEFENFYLILSNFIDRLSSIQTGLESVIESNKGD